MEDDRSFNIPKQITVTLDYIDKMIFQYQGMETTLDTRDILHLLDFIQYLDCNREKLAKILEGEN